MLYVNFPKHVKEITLRSDYKSLELFAEIGGYVGLFITKIQNRDSNVVIIWYVSIDAL